MRIHRLSIGALAAASVLAFTPASPAQATGGEDIIVYGDGVWRSTFVDMTDYKVPAACPGPTTQTVRVRFDKMATGSRLYVRNVRVVNFSARTLENQVVFNGRDYYTTPQFTTWGENVEKTLIQLVGGAKVSTNEAWYNGQAIMDMQLGTSGGELCQPSFLMKFYRR